MKRRSRALEYGRYVHDGTGRFQPDTGSNSFWLRFSDGSIFSAADYSGCRSSTCMDAFSASLQGGRTDPLARDCAADRVHARWTRVSWSLSKRIGGIFDRVPL